VKYYLKRYGPITVSLAVLFASGLAAGYRWGRLSVPASPLTPVVVETSEPGALQWIENAALALQKDFDLTPEQTDRVRTAIAGPARAIFEDRRQAGFKIHLRLLEAHDTLAREAGLSEPQKARLQVRREQLRQHILDKFKDIIGDQPPPALGGL
jgi:hypothetical protein